MCLQVNKKVSSKSSPVHLQEFLRDLKSRWIEKTIFNNSMNTGRVDPYMQQMYIPPIIAPALRVITFTIQKWRRKVPVFT